MNEMDYNNAEGIRRSDLWKMEDSPEKFKWYLEHPMEQTPAMAFGSACHKMVLEPDDFANEYVVPPMIDRRTKSGKEQWETFMAENEGKTIISAEDAQIMSDMAEKIRSNTIANRLINGKGQTEVPFFWTDQDTGVLCKAKSDRIVTDEDGHYIIIDYKTTICADTERFNYEIFKHGYHFQAGFYTEGLMTALNLDYRPRFLFVAQEKKAPYAVNVIEVSEDVMKIGVDKFHELLEKYKECSMLDIWPGYCENAINETQLPGWWNLSENE